MKDLVTWPDAGRYVVAVSGGCDSMTLLDVLARASDRGYELVVAHFDHGLRAASTVDRRLVERVAAGYGLPAVVEAGNLIQASEAAARQARHEFLQRVRRRHNAMAIVTAHHQDDLIETSLLNLARGTGRRGIAPMQDQQIIRPFRAVSRLQIRHYAQSHQLQWHEDATNEDRSNPRNFLRHELLPLADEAWRKRYLEIMEQMAALNSTIDTGLSRVGGSWSRAELQGLSLDEIAEHLHAAMHAYNPAVQLEIRLLQEIALFAKTGRPGRHRPLRQGVVLQITHDGAKLSFP